MIEIYPYGTKVRHKESKDIIEIRDYHTATFASLDYYDVVLFFKSGEKYTARSHHAIHSSYELILPNSIKFVEELK